MSERKRHPSTLIPYETVREAAYRLYLLRLEPPLTPEESRTIVREENGKPLTDAIRRKRSEIYLPWMRDCLRVQVDLEVVRLTNERGADSEHMLAVMQSAPDSLTDDDDSHRAEQVLRTCLKKYRI